MDIEAELSLQDLVKNLRNLFGDITMKYLDVTDDPDDDVSSLLASLADSSDGGLLIVQFDTNDDEAEFFDEGDEDGDEDDVEEDEEEDADDEYGDDEEDAGDEDDEDCYEEEGESVEYDDTESGDEEDDDENDESPFEAYRAFFPILESRLAEVAEGRIWVALVAGSAGAPGHTAASAAPLRAGELSPVMGASLSDLQLSLIGIRWQPSAPEEARRGLLSQMARKGIVTERDGEVYPTVAGHSRPLELSAEYGEVRLLVPWPKPKARPARAPEVAEPRPKAPTAMSRSMPPRIESHPTAVESRDRMASKWSTERMIQLPAGNAVTVMPAPVHAPAPVPVYAPAWTPPPVPAPAAAPITAPAQAWIPGPAPVPTVQTSPTAHTMVRRVQVPERSAVPAQAQKAIATSTPARVESASSELTRRSNTTSVSALQPTSPSPVNPSPAKPTPAVACHPSKPATSAGSAPEVRPNPSRGPASSAQPARAAGAESTAGPGAKDRSTQAVPTAATGRNDGSRVAHPPSAATSQPLSFALGLAADSSGEREKALLRLLRERGPSTARDLMKGLDCKRWTIRSILERLMATGVVRASAASAKSPNQKYELVR